MSSIIKTIEYHKGETKEFLKSIAYGGDLYSILNDSFVFRGHSQSIYELKPAALRNKEILDAEKLKTNKDTKKISEFLQIHSEKMLLQDFYKKCDDAGMYVPYIKAENKEYFLNRAIENSTFPDFDYWIPEELYELAALAQHYEVPTRLLDWSRDINVAIYFAMSDYLYKEKKPEDNDYMTIWALNGGALNKRNNDSPLKIIKPRYYSNPNLQAQRGVFTLWQVKKEEVLTSKPETPAKLNVVRNKVINSKPLDILIQNYSDEHPDRFQDKTIMYQIKLYDIKYQIPILYKYLERARITAQYLFPGYTGVAREIKEKNYLKNRTINSKDGLILTTK